MSKGGYVTVNENSIIYCNIVFSPKDPGFYKSEIILESISPKVRFDTYIIHGLCTSDYKYLSNLSEPNENIIQESILYHKCIYSWIKNIHLEEEEGIYIYYLLFNRTISSISS